MGDFDFQGGSASVASFGTHDDKVAAFLKATFAMDALGMAPMQIADATQNSIKMKNAGVQTQGSAVGIQ